MNNKLIIIFSLILLSCQPNIKTGENTSMQLDLAEVNMGQLKYKIPQSATVNFTNTGKNPLTIYEVKTSCGCTVPEWSKKPIKSGNKGTISLLYDSAFPGLFRKTITIFYNGINSPETILLKGEVEYPEGNTPISPKGDF